MNFTVNRTTETLCFLAFSVWYFVDDTFSSFDDNLYWIYLKFCQANLLIKYISSKKNYKNASVNELIKDKNSGWWKTLELKFYQGVSQFVLNIEQFFKSIYLC